MDDVCCFRNAKINFFVYICVEIFQSGMDAQELQRLKARFDIVGNDPALNHALETAVAVAPTDLTVLISGESGVGKEVLPQIIHSLSRRKTGKYLAVNCGGIPEGTINAELFGHEKGSFTGAVAERKGYFEEADGGTLFLDEIGELPRETQAMLLRVLQNGEFIKVGSSKVQKTDVRVIAATNVNLPFAVANGKFREDLYYRLNAVQIQMPSLRERKEDIYLLFRKFSSDFAELNNLQKLSLSHDAISLLCEYRWPGNIRQLKNVAEAVTGIESRPLTPTQQRIEIGADVLRRYIPSEKDTMIPAVCTSGGSSMSEDDKSMLVKAILDLKQDVEELKKIVRTPQVAAAPVKEEDDAEWQEPQEELSLKKAGDDLLEKALLKHNGSVKDAAAELGISERTVYRKLAGKKAGR